MARKSKAVREHQVRVFLFLSATVLFLGVSLLLFLTSVDLFSFNKRGKKKPVHPPRSAVSGKAVLAEVARHFRSQSGVAGVFCDFQGMPAEVFIRLKKRVSNKNFIDRLRHFLKNKNADLVSSRYERNSEYPVRLVVDISGKPMIIRAGWVERSDPPGYIAAPPGIPRIKKTVKEPSGSSRQPRIAIVLDDAGDRNPYQWLFLNLKARITFAVMPHLEDSVCFAERAKKRGFEIILHAPMEPLDRKGMRMPARMIRSGMTPGAVGRTLDGFLKNVPGVVGCNNHMGSRATGDRTLMRYFMAAMHGRNLFFLDSRTHSSSVAYEIARKAGVRALQRDVFLDHNRGYKYIQDRLVELARIAARRGYAVGIGHVTHRNMYLVLRRMIPKLKKTGFRFVHLSELFR